MPDPELPDGAAVLFKPLLELDGLEFVELDPEEPEAEELEPEEPEPDSELELDDCCADAAAA